MATITLRATKGTPLTNAEIDGNFVQLNLAKVELGSDLGGSTSAPAVVSLRGYALSSSAPVTGQTLTWSGAAWVPSTPAISVTGSAVTVLNDISYFLNQKDKIFTLKDGASAIVEGVNYRDNKDLTVVVGGRFYTPQIAQKTTGPWLVDYTAGRTYEYQVTGSRIIFYRELEARQTAQIRINNVSSSRQQRLRYPFSANTIAFGD
jgi:hypothetical protein